MPDLKDEQTPDIPFETGLKVYVEKPGTGIRQMVIGSASAQNVGTSTGDVLALDSSGQVPVARLPVMDLAEEVTKWQTIVAATGTVTPNTASGYNIILNAVGDITLDDIGGKADGPAAGFITFQQGSSTPRTFAVNTDNITTTSDLSVAAGDNIRTYFVWNYIPGAEGASATILLGKIGSEIEGPVTSVNGATGDVIITGDYIVNTLEARTGENRLSADAIKDLPSGGGTIDYEGDPIPGNFLQVFDSGGSVESVPITVSLIGDAGTMATASTSDYIAVVTRSGDGPLTATMNSGGSTGDSVLLDGSGNLDPTPVTDILTLNTFRTDKTFSANTLTLDLADTVLGRNYAVTATASYTIANPTNQAAGQAFMVAVLQDGTGGRVPSFGTHFRQMFDPSELGTAANTITTFVGIMHTVNATKGILLYASTEFVA